MCCLIIGLTDCLRVTTGNVASDEGTLEIIVNGEVVSSDNKNKLHGRGEMVVDKCFASLDKIEVRNPSNNGWIGSVSVSTDGGASYKPLADCPSCVAAGKSDRSGVIGVDGNGDMNAKIACINGATCELRVLPGLRILHGIPLSTCVCMYACLYACMYVCMYVNTFIY